MLCGRNRRCRAGALPACTGYAGRIENACAPRRTPGAIVTSTLNAPTPVPRLVDQFEHGLDAPICLTWELTYACNLACVHCLSSSGRRDPQELTTDQCKAVIDELERMQVF